MDIIWYLDLINLKNELKIQFTKEISGWSRQKRQTGPIYSTFKDPCLLTPYGSPFLVMSGCQGSRLWRSNSHHQSPYRMPWHTRCNMRWRIHNTRRGTHRECRWSDNADTPCKTQSRADIDKGPFSWTNASLARKWSRVMSMSTRWCTTLIIFVAGTTTLLIGSPLSLQHVVWWVIPTASAHMGQ